MKMKDCGLQGMGGLQLCKFDWFRFNLGYVSLLKPCRPQFRKILEIREFTNCLRRVHNAMEAVNVRVYNSREVVHSAREAYNAREVVYKRDEEYLRVYKAREAVYKSDAEYLRVYKAREAAYKRV